MSHFTRKEFLQASAALLASTVVGSSFGFKRSIPLLSFSTLGCPDWTFSQIMDFAVQHRYKGLELRGIQRQMDLTKCPEFNTPEDQQRTISSMKEKGLKFVNLGSSATLHFPEGEQREKNLDEGKRFIDLAQQIACPYIRVFPNNFPKERDKKETIDLIAKGLLTLGDYAKGKNVTVLMETHGDAVHIADITTIMQASNHPNIGLVWDPVNMWTVTKEAPTEAYQKLKKYIHHTHIKDAKLVDGKPQYTFLGQGEVPIFEAVDALTKGCYNGYFSFEWEKLWHPELAEPEFAIADYTKAMRKHFASL